MLAFHCFSNYPLGNQLERKVYFGLQFQYVVTRASWFGALMRFGVGSEANRLLTIFACHKVELVRKEEGAADEVYASEAHCVSACFFQLGPTSVFHHFSVA